MNCYNWGVDDSCSLDNWYGWSSVYGYDWGGFYNRYDWGCMYGYDWCGFHDRYYRSVDSYDRCGVGYDGAVAGDYGGDDAGGGIGTGQKCSKNELKKINTGIESTVRYTLFYHSHTNEMHIHNR